LDFGSKGWGFKSSLARSPMQYLVAAILMCVLASSAGAAGSDYAEAMRVRRLVIEDPSAPAPAAAEEIALPVSRPFDQRGTELCWAYATLSGLETAHRVRNPQTAVELSRRAMQYRTIEDRFLRRIHGTGTYAGERGVAVDAMRMIADGGLVAFGDFTDIDDPYGSTNIGSCVSAAVGVDAKIAALRAGLAEKYGVPPPETHLDGAPLTAASMAARLTEGQVWESYAVAHDGVEGYRPHPDPDARPGARAWFMPRAALVARIRAALKAGHPLELTIGGHCVLIYGAAYDPDGRPVRYLIKDSYPSYFYKADPARVMSQLVEVTTAKLAAPAR
jgi:hypothetical protein